jgi:hypothetical protein
MTPTAARLPAAAPPDSRSREPALPRHSCRARSGARGATRCSQPACGNTGTSST